MYTEHWVHFCLWSFDKKILATATNIIILSWMSWVNKNARKSIPCKGLAAKTVFLQPGFWTALQIRPVDEETTIDVIFVGYNEHWNHDAEICDALKSN